MIIAGTTVFSHLIAECFVLCMFSGRVIFHIVFKESMSHEVRWHWIRVRTLHVDELEFLEVHIYGGAVHTGTTKKSVHVASEKTFVFDRRSRRLPRWSKGRVGCLNEFDSLDKTF